MGDFLVLAVLGVVVLLVIRSMHKTRKKGGGCTGNCASCGHCK